MVEVVPSCGSTNTLVLEGVAWQGGGKIRRVLAAEYQEAGRGRRGRVWQADPGKALLFSVLWEIEYPVDSVLLGVPPVSVGGATPPWEGFSLTAGLAVVCALEQLGLSGVRLKWPNDIIVPYTYLPPKWKGGKVHYAKLGGILVELHRITEGWRIVAGVGLNAYPSNLLGESDPPAVSWHELGLKAVRNEVWVLILSQLQEYISLLWHKGWGALGEAWEQRHWLQGQEVLLYREGQVPLGGRVIGVDQRGALLLQTEGGICAFESGDVSVRPEGEVRER